MKISSSKEGVAQQLGQRSSPIQVDRQTEGHELHAENCQLLLIGGAG